MLQWFYVRHETWHGSCRWGGVGVGLYPGWERGTLSESGGPLTPLWNHLLSRSNILILPVSSLCWWNSMWWPTGDESLLCSFRRCFSAISVCPTYCASQSWHVRWYTTPHLSSGLSHSFGATTDGGLGLGVCSDSRFSNAI